MDYGSSYKTIRTNKKITQKDVCKDFLSRSTLAKFESGKLVPSIEKFEYMLEQIDMSYAEFIFISNGYVPSLKQGIYDKFFSLKGTNKKEMKELLATCEKCLVHENNWKVQMIHDLLQVLLLVDFKHVGELDRLAEKYVAKLWKDLSEKEEWYVNDCFFINCILFYFPLETAINIGNELIIKLEKYHNYKNIEPLQCSIFLNLSLLFYQKKDYQRAYDLANQGYEMAKNLKRYDFLTIAMVRRGLSKGDQEQVQQGIAILESLGDELLTEAVKEEVAGLQRKDENLAFERESK